MKDILLVHAGSRNLLEHIAAAHAAGHHIMVVDDTTAPETIGETLRELHQSTPVFSDATLTNTNNTNAFLEVKAVKNSPRDLSQWNHSYPPPRRKR